jgi:hypothetical protein
MMRAYPFDACRTENRSAMVSVIAGPRARSIGPGFGLLDRLDQASQRLGGRQRVALFLVQRSGVEVVLNGARFVNVEREGPLATVAPRDAHLGAWYAPGRRTVSSACGRSGKGKTVCTNQTGVPMAELHRAVITP